MSQIQTAIQTRNEQGALALSIFLTAGFPDKNKFTDTVLHLFDAGADMIEIGMPFSDPIADGPVIQKASYEALQNGVDIPLIFEYIRKIRSHTDKPLILMGYANPVLQYGLTRFLEEAVNSRVDGLIIPDIPLDEDHTFWDSKLTGIDRILLTTPTSSEQRIRDIDIQSEGFVYCVSVTGTTGARDSFPTDILDNLNRTRKLITKNKMMTGFGISGPGAVQQLKPFCDGIIVGSAVIKRLLASAMDDATELVRLLRDTCDKQI